MGFVEEIFNFYASGLPAKRPNSMNNYGIILNEIGLEPMINELQRILQPLGELLFPGPGDCWDGHHCFIVRYREGEDLGLGPRVCGRWTPVLRCHWCARSPKAHTYIPAQKRVLCVPSWTEASWGG